MNAARRAGAYVRTMNPWVPTATAVVALLAVAVVLVLAFPAEISTMIHTSARLFAGTVA